MGNETVEFTTSWSVLDHLVKVGQRFTSQEPGALHYLRCILLEALEGGGGELVATAESVHHAIRLRSTEVEVIQPGRILVQASWLSTALGVIQPNQKVDVRYEESESRLYLTSSDGAKVDIAVAPVKDQLQVPTLEEPTERFGLEVDPEEFAAAYYVGSGSRQINGQHRILEGVFTELVEEGGDHYLRLMSGGRLGLTTCAVGVRLKGDLDGEGYQPLVLQHDSMDAVLGYLREGQKATIYSGDGSKRRLHIIVSGKEDHPIYHIRLAVMDLDPSKYPIVKLQAALDKMLDQTYGILKVDKLELIRILRSAASIGSLDPHSSNGQARRVGITISSTGVKAEVMGEANYDETIPVLDWSVPEAVRFNFMFGIMGHSFVSYPGRDNLNLALITKPGPDGAPHALVLFEGDSPTSESARNYLCSMAVSDGEFL